MEIFLPLGLLLLIGPLMYLLIERRNQRLLWDAPNPHAQKMAAAARRVVSRIVDPRDMPALAAEPALDTRHTVDILRQMAVVVLATWGAYGALTLLSIL
ncbi:MAG: hypothetical protein WAX89_01735 [Alphaproteobacteria bacterium]